MIASYFCFSQESNPVVDAQEKISWEKSVVANNSFDFGEVKIGSNLEHVVELKNVTDQSFEVASVSSSCGCMKPTLQFRTMGAGASGELNIRLNTERFRGRRSASIHILFAQPPNREIKISANVNILNLNCEPEQVQFLDDATSEKKERREIVVRRDGSPHWKIK